MHIRVTRDRFGLITRIYAAYMAIDRLSRNVVHLSFLRTRVESFSSRLKIHRASPSLYLFVSFPHAVGRHLSFSPDQSVRVHRTGEMIERLNM